MSYTIAPSVYNTHRLNTNLEIGAMESTLEYFLWPLLHRFLTKVKQRCMHVFDS